MRFGSILLLLSTVTSGAQTFQTPHKISLNADPTTVAVADFNNDGAPDLLIGFGSSTSQVLRTYLSTGSGNYSAAGEIDLPIGTPLTCHTADINGDGRIDVVCPPSTSSLNVLVYFGNGNGTFASPIPTSLGNNLGVVTNVAAIADMNLDGHLDIMVSGQYGTDYMLLGDGTGHFKVSTFGGMIAGGNSTIADVNGDGIPDLLAPSPIILIGKGDGSFRTQFSYPGYNCTYGDFERTHRLSAACSDVNGAIQFFHINADGSFNTANPIASATFPAGTKITSPIQAIDLNGDGILDLALNSPDGLQIVLGKPSLQFTTPVPYAAGSTYFANYGSGIFTDVNGDGFPDFVAVGPHAAYISYGSASGTLAAPILTQSGTSLYTSVTGDFNGDGIADVITIGQPGIAFLAGKGDGTFTAPVPVSLGSYTLSAGIYIEYPQPLVADFNGDGHPDFILQLGSSPSVLFLGKGDGTFAAPVPVSSQMLPAPSSAYAYALLDIDGDRKSDVVEVQNATITSYLSRGDGTFTSIPTGFPNSASQNTGIALADFNGDHFLDAAIDLVDHVVILPGRGDGSFGSYTAMLTVPGLTGTTLQLNVIPIVATADFDGDGAQDIAVLASYVVNLNSAVQYSTALWIFFGNGDGTFAAPVSAGVFDRPYSSMLASDLNHTGRADIILSRVSNSTDFSGPLAFIASLPGRTFTAENFLAGGDFIDSISLGDFNKDGLIDIMVSNGYVYQCPSQCGNEFALLLNSGPAVTGSVSTSPQPSYISQPYQATATIASTSSPGAALTGSISFALDGTALGMVPLVANSASITISSGLTAGTHRLTALWPGDATYVPLSLNATHTIVLQPTLAVLTAAPNPAPVSATVTLSAVITATSGTPTPTGSVVFFDGPTQIATAPVDATGHANASLSTLAVGTHTLTAVYTATGIFASSTSASYLETITQPATSSISLTAQPNPATVLTPVVFTAQLSLNNKPAGAGIPVILTIDTTPIALTTDATGTVNYTSSTLAVGKHAISVAASNSTTLLTETILPNPADFTLTLAAPTLTIQTQHHLTTTLNLTSINAFAGTLAITCTNLPAYVTCLPTPSVPSLSANATMTISLYIDTDSVLGYVRSMPLPTYPRPFQVRLAFLLLPASLLAFRRRRPSHRRILVLALTAPLALALSGCGNIIVPANVRLTSIPPSAAPGTYTISITATGAITGIAHTANLSLTITP